MKLKEKTDSSINKMNENQLISIYESVQLLQNLNIEKIKRTASPSIEAILEMTKTSKSCWSESVIEEREDRL